MNTRRSEKIERQRGLWKKSIPFAEWEFGVNGTENRDEMILEGANCTLSRVGSMFFGGNTLILDLILSKGVFEILGTFVVKDVKIGWVTLVQEDAMGLLPCIANTGGFAIWNGHGMDGICVLVVENKNIVIAAA